MFEKRTIKGVPKHAENLQTNSNGYHMFGQNIQYQYPQKILLDEKYLCRIEKPILAYASSVGEIGIIQESFYRSGDNGAFQGLFPKFKTYNKLHILFLLAILRKQFDNFGYSTSMKDILNLKISLPVLPTLKATKEIHFNYMENFIKALEKDRIKQVILYQKAVKKAYEKVVAKK